MQQLTALLMLCATQGRNRRCITVDLHKPEGREVVRKLAARCDVLVENFRPGVMEKWGLGPQDLPNTLVYARISGYGQVGMGWVWAVVLRWRLWWNLWWSC